ncbi:hypothetical protein [Massilia sp. IC2-476]|uniref:hypothetical protein n=1 Tax=Massilia sp. IC2-476 TaxID=2887199 RepID=UPI001D12326C|nr:hypothetical protein [Massilia sp. IC2-476]MCC2972846.1 hypothetical protein [Massilia sp. IC2-476]
MSFAAAYGDNTVGSRGNRRFLVGIGVSVVLHVMLMLAYRGHVPALPALEPEPSAPIAVRILPPPPPPAPPRVEPKPQPRAEPAAPRPARPSTPKPVIAFPASPQQEASPDSFSVQQAEEPAPSEAPQFDINAARQTARQLASQTKLGREGNANAQFPDPPLETETKAARAINKAKRRDCKDGVPGGLLAPLFLMMDKKDHGCKW